jgi:hypothetical protein
MHSDLLPAPVPAVILQNVADGAVLFLPSTEIYFGLNDVGAVVWSLLPPRSATMGELLDSMCELYPDVERAVIEQDVVELLQELQDNHLVARDPRRRTSVEANG